MNEKLQPIPKKYKISWDYYKESYSIKLSNLEKMDNFSKYTDNDWHSGITKDKNKLSRTTGEKNKQYKKPLVIKILTLPETNLSTILIKIFKITMKIDKMMKTFTRDDIKKWSRWIFMYPKLQFLKLIAIDIFNSRREE